ncbi:hypothetical protein GALL_515240 [mine drainage metagenome]|uniref:Uncharacterized protein n=1 Tax=mine drainage metagenome TaxID=410659 RepID=A0A1J5P5U9_9ZZZZ
MMIAAAKKIDRDTSAAAVRMACCFMSIMVLAEIAACSLSDMRLVCASRRKIASTMMTVASTIRPKSIAPTDNRLADSPRSTRMLTAKNSANGIVAPTMMALRRSPRNSHCRTTISTIPSTMFSSTVFVVVSIRSFRS